MSSKKPTGSQSASDWYQQLMSKIPTQDQPTTASSKGKKVASTKAAKTVTTPKQKEQDLTTLLDEPIEAPKPVQTGLLLSERTDIWSAVDSIKAMKTSNKALSVGGGMKRKIDNKIAKLEAADVDNDDFLANLMKNRTGDAFDDLAAQVEEQQEMLKQQRMMEKKMGEKKLVKKVVISEKNNVSSTKQSATTPTTTKQTKTLDTLPPQSALKNKKKVVEEVEEEEEVKQVAKKQKVVETTKSNTKTLITSTKIVKKDPIVQLPPPQTDPTKPAGWTPQHGRYFSDKSKIGISKSFDNFQKSLPAWYMDPAYQLEVRRLIDVVNNTKKYTPSPMSQWFPKVEVVKPVVQKQIQQVEEFEEEEEESEEERPIAKKTQKDDKKKEKKPNLFQMEDIDSTDEDDVNVDFEDVDGEDFFSDEDEDMEEVDEDDEEIDEDEEEIDEDEEEIDEDDEEEDPFANDVTPEIQSVTSQLRSRPATLSHQILILPNTDDRIEAIRDFHKSITEQEERSRMKTKMVIVVRDGRVANQLICQIGLRITKHRKNNRGMSNAGLTVETKGVEMLHERYNDQQRRKALEKFQRGSVQTLIVTDDYLSMLWPFRSSIGIMVHYDIPLHRDQQNGKKNSSKLQQMENMTKAEILQQAQTDKTFTKNHTISTMAERLGYCQRTELNFPDQYYIKQYSPLDRTKLVAKLPNPKQPFKNVSLTFLVPTRACQAYAESMASIYQHQYNAPKTAEALEKFALKKPTQ